MEGKIVDPKPVQRTESTAPWNGPLGGALWLLLVGTAHVGRVGRSSELPKSNPNPSPPCLLSTSPSAPRLPLAMSCACALNGVRLQDCRITKA